jgi:outer membrane lipoprotein-sorting protein
MLEITRGAAFAASLFLCMTTIGLQEARSQEPAAPAGVAAADTAGMPTSDQVLAKYIKSIGGTYVIERLAGRTAKGTVTDAGGAQVPFELYERYPSAANGLKINPNSPAQRYSIVHLSGGDAIASYNGDAGWVMSKGQVRDMTPAELDAARLEDPFYFCMRMKQVFKDLKTEDKTEKIGDREAYVLAGHTQNLPAVKIYFDKETGMLLALAYAESADAKLTRVEFGDYQNPDAAYKGGPHRIPFRWTITQPNGGKMTYQLKEVLQNIPIDEAKFVKPNATTASAK